MSPPDYPSSKSTRPSFLRRGAGFLARQLLFPAVIAGGFYAARNLNNNSVAHVREQVAAIVPTIHAQVELNSSLQTIINDLAWAKEAVHRAIGKELIIPSANFNAPLPPITQLQGTVQLPNDGNVVSQKVVQLNLAWIFLQNAKLQAQRLLNANSLLLDDAKKRWLRYVVAQTTSHLTSVERLARTCAETIQWTGRTRVIDILALSNPPATPPAASTAPRNPTVRPLQRRPAVRRPTPTLSRSGRDEFGIGRLGESGGGYGGSGY